MDTFPSRLRSTREARGLSQLELAIRIGADPIIISRYERGKVRPRLDRAERLSEALSVSLDWLIRGEGAGPLVSPNPQAS